MSGDNYLGLYYKDVEPVSLIQKLENYNFHIGSFCSDGRYFAFCQRFETKIWIWDLTNNNLFYKNTKKLGFATNIKWSENGNYLIVYSVTNFGPGRIKVWDKFSWSSRDIVL
jgi:hypothetical protein